MLKRETQVRIGLGVFAALSLLMILLGLFVLSPARLTAA